MCSRRGPLARIAGASETTAWTIINRRLVYVVPPAVSCHVAGMYKYVRPGVSSPHNYLHNERVFVTRNLHSTVPKPIFKTVFKNYKQFFSLVENAFVKCKFALYIHTKQKMTFSKTVSFLSVTNVQTFFLFFRPRISSAHLPFPYIYQTF